MFKDKKNVIILILSIVVLIFIIAMITIIINQHHKNSKDGSNLSSSELLEMLYQEDYKIEITNIDKTIHITLKNKKKGITIQRIYNTYLGTLMTFENDIINDERADVIKLSNNTTNKEKQQYKAYEDWLEYYNITQTQISEMLDYYYDINKNKTETINTEELLNSFNGKNENVEASENISELTYPQTRYYLENKGYVFETISVESDNFNSTYFTNETITVSAMIFTDEYKYLIEYSDKSIDGPACGITDTSRNTTESKHQQYDSYLKWKNSIGLSQEQINEVLLKYYLENN